MKGENKKQRENRTTLSIQSPGAAQDSAEVQLEKMMKQLSKERDLIHVFPSLNPPPLPNWVFLSK